jgi:hypothetical protein
MSENQLKGYFAFDDSDLIANKAGRLSPKQTKKLTANDQFTQRILFGFVIVCVALALFFLYRAFVDATRIGSWIGVVLAGYFASFFARGLFNKIDYSVQRAQGIVDFIKVEKRGGSVSDPLYKRPIVSSYEMHISGESFANANPALIEYMQGDVYAVYYAKDTKQILSVEFISKGK